MWRLDKDLCLKLMLLGLVVLPVLGSGGVRSHGSLRGALQALERRRRAPSGPYPLANFQIPDKAVEYMSSNHQGYQSDGPSILMDQNGHRQPSGKDILVEYLDKDDDYLPEDMELNYKETAFRNRNAEMNGHHNHINEKKRSSSFRERQVKRSYQSDRLKELFMKELSDQDEDVDEQQRRNQLRYKSDTENAELLKELWGKYKNEFPEDLSRVYKERSIRKRQIPGDYTPTGWGPIAFKRKRSSNQRIDDGETPNDFLYSLKFVSQSDPSVVENLKDEKISDEEDDLDVSKIVYNRYQEPRYPEFDVPPPKSTDLRDEYMLALQPLNGPHESVEYLPEEEDYIYDNSKEKRFPVSKRSSPYSSSSIMYHQDKVKRNLKSDKKKLYRSSGTDPRVVKELSSIFDGKDAESQAESIIQKPVKRSSIADDDSHESKSPAASAHAHDSNETHSDHDEETHQHISESDHSHRNSDQPHSRHEHDSKPPLLTSSNGHDHSHENEENKEVNFDDTEETHIKLEHPIVLKKKSIDWSNYFGIDKRKKKSLNTHGDMKSLKESYLNKAKRYMNSYSLQNFRLHDHPDGLKEQPSILRENIPLDKRNPKQIDEIKLDNMDNKLKNMENVIVDEALRYSGTSDGLDTKEEQEVKEKILSRLAAAYSLEKMRKALREFKASLQAQRFVMKDQLPLDYEEDKEKRASTTKFKQNKKESDLHTQEDLKHVLENNGVDVNDQDFENEQGAGHFLNGPVESMSEGYMGGSGMKNKPDHLQGPESGACPVLDRIVRRCHTIDILAGDHGQLFLPLCSLHQICYLCGPSSPTGCDLIFLSEADSMCSGREACQEAARAAVMSLRDLHDTMTDDMEGECSPGNCLSQAIETNAGWQQALNR